MEAAPWSGLPNGKRIDFVFAHLQDNPMLWGVRTSEVTQDSFPVGWMAAHEEAWCVILPAGRRDMWYRAWDAVRDFTRSNDLRELVWDSVWGAFSALVAWDDCGSILDLPPDAVRLLAISGHQPAILLYPAVVAINSKE